MFLSCKNRPIENANLLAGAWRLTLSAKLCRRCYFLQTRPFISASFRATTGTVKLAQQISLDQSIAKWKTIMFVSFKEL